VAFNIPGLRIALFRTAVILATAVHAHERTPFAQEDPNLQFLCRGSLSDYAACQCKEDEGEVACINAQFVDTEVFFNLNAHYKTLQKVTFHGNNFQDLPSSSLFGPVSHSRLHTLNISANYIVNLNSNALKGLPNLRVLDLSNNEIVLKESDVDFLTHTPRLTHLYLRRAFTATINRTVQFDLMMRMFQRANLKHLEVLDLSYNFLQSVPYDLPCPFPSLSSLDLRQNFLKTLSVNASCVSNIRFLDLSRNQFYSLTPAFRQLASLARPDTYVLRNPFHCDCKSSEYVTWVRSTDVIRDKHNLVCDRASPRNFVGARLVEVPLHKLDCSVNLFAMGSNQPQFLTLLFVAVVIYFFNNL
uniref:LRRCT domain-containing protein n=1 Tax=Haemonchus contortus TaxID=6289 RepID=A0A7I4YZ64_HAECO